MRAELGMTSGLEPKRIALILPALPARARARGALGSAVEPEQLADLWAACVSDLLETGRRVHRTSRTFIAVSGTDRFAREAQRQGWEVVEAGASSLARATILTVAERALITADAVLLLNSCAPSVPAEALRALVTGLETHDVVYGPTEQGGWWGLGARMHLFGIIADFEIDAANAATRLPERCAQEAASLYTGEEWYELDTVADLQRLALESGAEAASTRAASLRSAEFARFILSST